MRKERIFYASCIAAVLSGIALGAAAENNFQSVFREGSINVELRAYHNYRNFRTIPDTSAFATGMNLQVRTGFFRNFSAAGALYISDDLGTRSSNPARNNPNFSENIRILGQAYLQYENTSNLLRAGRQLVNTPFANPSDAFMVPIAYEGVAYTRKNRNGLTLNALYLDRIKGRPDDRFSDIVEFSANRFQNTGAPGRGVWAAGADYEINTTALRGWWYLIPDQFHLMYFQVDRSFSIQRNNTCHITAQLIHERDHGDSILGKINTNIGGLRTSLNKGFATLYAAWNYVRNDHNAFNHGGLLSPFTFSTGPIFTNSMVQTMENSTPGNAYKVGLEVNLSNWISTALSYASYQRKGANDTRETDIDIIYRFSGSLERLSLRLRVGLIGADRRDAKMTEIRTQIQYHL